MARADDSIYVSLGMAIPALLLLLGVFDILRVRLWWVYTPRVRHPKYSKSTPRAPRGGYLMWIPAVMENYSAERILEVSGLDGLVMILFLQFITDQCFLLAVIGTTVLLPAWYTAEGLESNEDTRNQYSFALTTVANLKQCVYKEEEGRVARLFPPCENSGLHWRYALAVITAWIYTLRALSRLSITCCDYVKYRERYVAGRLLPASFSQEEKSLISITQQRLSVIVERVPVHLRSMRGLKNTFEHLCGKGSVHSARVIVDDLGELKSHHARRVAAIEKLFDKRARRARQRFLQLNEINARRTTWDESTSLNTFGIATPDDSGGGGDKASQVVAKPTTLTSFLNRSRSWNTDSTFNSERRKSQLSPWSAPSAKLRGHQAEFLAVLERAVNSAEHVVERARRNAVSVQPEQEEEADNEHCFDIDEPRIVRRDHNNRKHKILAVPYFETLVDELEDRILLEHAYRLVVAFHPEERRSHVNAEDILKQAPARRERYKGCFWLMSKRQPLHPDDEDETSELVFPQSIASSSSDLESNDRILSGNPIPSSLSLRQRFLIWLDLKIHQIDKELAKISAKQPLPQVFVSEPFCSKALPELGYRLKIRAEALIYIDIPDGIITVIEAMETVVKTLAGRRCFRSSKSVAERQEDVDSGFVGSSTAFVTFTSPTATLTAMQSLLVSEPYGFFAQAAPESRDIIWSNVHKEYDGILRRSKLVSLALRVGIIFWASVVGFCANSVQLLYLLGLRKFSNAFQAIVVSVAPVLLLLAIINLLPLCFQALARFYERQKSYSAIDFSVVDRFFLYQGINVYGSIFSAAIINSIRKGWQNPYFFIKKLGQTIYTPAAMVYFAKFIIFSCAASPLWCIRAWPLISRGPKYSTLVPPDLPGLLYGWSYPKLLMAFTIVSTFWIAAPLISVLAFFYFNLIQLYYRYLLLWVHMPVYESGGGYFKRCVNMICIGLCVSNVLLFLWFLTNSLTGYALCVLPLPFMVVSFHSMAKDAYFYPTQCISLTEARNIENAGIDTRGFDPSLYLQPERRRPGSVKSSSLPGRSLKVRLAQVLKMAGCSGSVCDQTPILQDSMDDLDSLPDEEKARRIARFSARSKNTLHPDTIARLRALSHNARHLRHICRGLENVYSGNADFFDTEDDEVSDFTLTLEHTSTGGSLDYDESPAKSCRDGFSSMDTPTATSPMDSPLHSPIHAAMPPVATTGELELFPRIPSTIMEINYDEHPSAASNTQVSVGATAPSSHEDADPGAPLAAATSDAGSTDE